MSAQATSSVKCYSFPSTPPVGFTNEELGESTTIQEPQLTRSLVLSVMKAVNTSLNITFQDTEITDVIQVDEQGTPYVVEVQAQEEQAARSFGRGIRPRRQSRGESTKPGSVKVGGLNHYRLICEACGHIVLAVIGAVLKAVKESQDDAPRRSDISGAKPIAPMRKKRGGILGFKELAAKAKLSPWHFHRVFRTVTGVTPKAYGEALWDYLMKQYGFEVEDFVDGHVGYSISGTPGSEHNDKTDFAAMSSAGGLQSTGPSNTHSQMDEGLQAAASGGSAPQPIPSSSQICSSVGSMSSMGSVGGVCGNNTPGTNGTPGQYAGRVRKSVRAAQQRPSRSRSRNRSQTQQHLMQTLSQMQISASSGRSPSPAPHQQYMGSSVMNPSSNSGGGTMAASGLSQSMGNHSQNNSMDISGSGLNTASADPLGSLFPSLDSGFVNQSYDNLGIKSEIGSEWMEPDADFLAKSLENCQWQDSRGPDNAVSTQRVGSRITSKNVANINGRHALYTDASEAAPPAVYGGGGPSDADCKPSWLSQEQRQLSQMPLEQGLMLNLMSPQANPPAMMPGSNSGADPGVAISPYVLPVVPVSDDVITSLCLNDASEFDEDRYCLDLDYYPGNAAGEHFTVDGNENDSPVFLTNLEEDGIQDPVCF